MCANNLILGCDCLGTIKVGGYLPFCFRDMLNRSSTSMVPRQPQMGLYPLALM